MGVSTFSHGEAGLSDKLLSHSLLVAAHGSVWLPTPADCAVSAMG